MELNEDSLRKIGNYILEGLSEDEACILSGIEPGVLAQARKTAPKIDLFVKKKQIEFKREHIKTIREKRNDKSSMWLLENLRPDEFGGKKKPDGSNTINVLAMLIKDVQERNSSAPVAVKVVDATAPAGSLGAGPASGSGDKLRLEDVLI